jgi:protocatechuate 4,5-dioxygenase, alpha chain
VIPNDGEPVDLLARFTDDAVLRRKVLVDNPTLLAWNDAPFELGQEQPVTPRQNERSTIRRRSAIMSAKKPRPDIPGTIMFDGTQAQKGYGLNKMCYSFNAAQNRAEFLRDEDAYCRRFGLNEAQRNAIRNKNVTELIAAGGNIYYLAKFAGIFGLDVQDVGAQQTGMTKDAFKAKLVEAGR